MGKYSFNKTSNDDVRIAISKTKKTDLATIKFYDGLSELIGQSIRISHDKDLDRLYFLEDPIGHKVNDSTGQMLAQARYEVDILRPYAFGVYPLQKDGKGYYINLSDKKDTDREYHKSWVVAKPKSGYVKKHSCYTTKKGVSKIMEDNVIAKLVDLLTTLEDPAEIKAMAIAIKILKRIADEQSR